MILLNMMQSIRTANYFVNKGNVYIGTHLSLLHLNIYMYIILREQLSDTSSTDAASDIEQLKIKILLHEQMLFPWKHTKSSSKENKQRDVWCLSWSRSRAPVLPQRPKESNSLLAKKSLPSSKCLLVPVVFDVPGCHGAVVPLSSLDICSSDTLSC